MSNTITKAKVDALLLDIARKEGELRQAVARAHEALRRMDDPVSPAPVTIPGSYRIEKPKPHHAVVKLSPAQMEAGPASTGQLTNAPAGGLEVELLSGVGESGAGAFVEGVYAEQMSHVTKLSTEGMLARRKASKEEEAQIATLMVAVPAENLNDTYDPVEEGVLEKRAELLRHAQESGTIPVLSKDTAEKRLVDPERLRNIGRVLASYLSKDVMLSGVGYLKPGVSGLCQYKEDLNTAPRKIIETWPTGFYRSSTTSQRQLLINLPNCLFVAVPLDAEYLADLINNIRILPKSGISQATPTKEPLMLKDLSLAELDSIGSSLVDRLLDLQARM